MITILDNADVGNIKPKHWMVAKEMELEEAIQEV